MNPVTFNAEFYLAQNADVAAAVAAGDFPDAFAHFQEFGQFELRQPNAFFDPIFYLSNNPDVLRAVASGQIESAFSHFIEFGQFEGAVRAPSAEFVGFDEQAYLDANPDVAASVARGEFANGFTHFLQFGVNENREGAPNFEPGQDPLSQALTALRDAQTAAVEFFEDRPENSQADLEATLAGAERDLELDVQTNGSDRALANNLADAREQLTDANAAIDAVTGLRAAVTALDTAEANLETAQAAVALTEIDQAAELARFNLPADRADVTINPDGSVNGILVVSSAGVVSLATGVTEANTPGVTALQAASQANVTADRNLATATTALNTAQAEVDRLDNADAARAAAQADLDAANDDLDDATATADLARTAETEEAATTATAFGGGVVTVNPDGTASFLSSTPESTPEPVIVVGSDGGLVTAPGLADGELTAATNLLADVNARLVAEGAEDAAIADAAEAQEAFDNVPAPGSNPLVEARDDAVTAIETAEDAISDRALLVEAVTDAEAAVAEFQGLLDAIDAAEVTLADLNVDNVEIVDGVDDFGTAEADLFVATTANSTITGFEAGEDVLFIGGGFTRVDLADDADFGDGVGSASALEVFIQQTDAGAVVTLEQEAFAGNAPGFDGLTSITLAGVDADDITIDANGFLRVTPEAEALAA